MIGNRLRALLSQGIMLPMTAMVSRTPDIELVNRFKAGDQSAYAEIVRRYQDRVYSMCFRWLGNEQVARETAQDVFLSLYRALPKFRGDAQLSTWMYRVVVNHCKNKRLWRQRRQMHLHESLEGPRNDDDAPVRQYADDGPGSDAGAHRSEAEALVAEGLAQLDDEHRSIIVLRDVQDLGYEEIAEILDVPRGTVKSRLHRARAQLARVLARRIRREDVI